MIWTIELASYLVDAPWPATKEELIEFARKHSSNQGTPPSKGSPSVSGVSGDKKYVLFQNITLHHQLFLLLMQSFLMKEDQIQLLNSFVAPLFQFCM